MAKKMSPGRYVVDPVATPSLGIAVPQRCKARVARILGYTLLRACDERGSALVEMALVLPILLMLVTGIAAFGIAFGNDLSLTDAVSIAGRQIAVSRGNTTDPCALAATSVKNGVPSGMTPANLTFNFVFNGVSYGPYTGVSNASCASATNTTGAAGNLQQGQNAQLIVSYPCNLTIYGYNYAPTCKLNAQVTELVQ